MKDTKIEGILQKLKEPFARNEWRVGRKVGNDRVSLLAYIDARDVMNRFDEVIGSGNWSDSYQVYPNGIICTISVFGISKADGAEMTDIEAFKGGMSDAFKRAAVKWGVGRYLYDLPEAIVPLLSERPKQPHGYYKDKDSGRGFFFLYPGAKSEDSHYEPISEPVYYEGDDEQPEVKPVSKGSGLKKEDPKDFPYRYKIDFDEKEQFKAAIKDAGGKYAYFGKDQGSLGWCANIEQAPPYFSEINTSVFKDQEIPF